LRRLDRPWPCSGEKGGGKGRPRPKGSMPRSSERQRYCNLHEIDGDDARKRWEEKREKTRQALSEENTHPTPIEPQRAKVVSAGKKSLYLNKTRGCKRPLAEMTWMHWGSYRGGGGGQYLGTALFALDSYPKGGEGVNWVREGGGRGKGPQMRDAQLPTGAANPRVHGRRQRGRKREISMTWK